MSAIQPSDITAIAWRVASCAALLGAALLFGRSLRPPSVALIERVALVGDPGLPANMRLYTRRLTAVWCAWFVAAAVLTLAVHDSPLGTGLLVWAGTGLLFVGEHILRPFLFPGHRFPGLAQQLRDTWQVWRPR